MKKKKRGKDRPPSHGNEFKTNAPNQPEHEETDNDESPEIIDPPEKTDNFETLYKETLDRYTRTLAEFDNFRKRTIKEKAVQYDDGVRTTAEKLLPVVDNFERAMAAGEATHADDTFYQGIALIARQFIQALEGIGVTRLPTMPGDDFNTDYHNAVAHVEDDNFGPSQVAVVLQKGYEYKGKVIRHDMVKVAN
jgi:molecular chaperone GrpE